MDLFFNNNFENIFNIELLSIRIENTSRLKIFNPWTLREDPALEFLELQVLLPLGDFSPYGRY